MGSRPDTGRLVSRRSAIMTTIRDAPRTKRDLAAELDVSRSTVDRGIRELEQADFVTRTDAGLRLTLPGRLALESYENHAAELAAIDTLRQDLESFPSDLDLPAALFRDPTIITPDRHAPHRPSETLIDLLDGADIVKHYATGIRPEYEDYYWQRVFDGGRLEVVATADVVSESINENNDHLTRAFETGNFSLAETEDARPYSLVIADDRDVCVLLYDDHALMGLIRNDNPATASWAVDHFERLQRGARAITVPVEE